MATYESRLVPTSVHKAKTKLLGERASSTWHTDLVSRDGTTMTHVKDKSKAKSAKSKDAASVFDFPSDEASKPSRKPQPAKDDFDFPDSDQESKKRNVQPAKPRAIKPVGKVASSTLQVSEPAVLKKLPTHPPARHSRSRSTDNPPKNLKPTASKRPEPLSQIKRKRTEGALDFPPSSEEDRPILKTPTRVKHSSPAKPNNIFDFPDDETPKASKTVKSAKKTQTARAGASKEPGTASRTTTKSVSKPRSSRASSQASSRARTTKSPESVKSHASRSRVSKSRSVTKKTTPAPDHLKLVFSEPSTPADPTFARSTVDRNFETPEPQTPRTLRPAESATPRQSALWSRLLQDDADIGVPSIQRLQLDSSSKRSFRDSSPSDLEAPTKRVKLVTSLKQATIEEEDEEDEEESVMGYELEDEQVEVPQVLSQLHGPVKIKYGQQRSVVATQEEDEGDMLNMIMEDLDIPAEPKKTNDQFDFGFESEEEEASQLLTAQELRAAGSKRRLLSEFEHMLDGIQGGDLTSLSAQRLELLELTKKLFDPENVSLLLDYSLDRRLVDAVSKSDDVIIHFITAVCLNLIVDKSNNLAAFRHIRKSGCLERITKLLTMGSDISKIAKDRKLNMSRIAQDSIIEFKGQIKGLQAWSGLPADVVSPQIAAIIVLENMARKTREAGGKETIVDEDSVMELSSIMEETEFSSDTVRLVELILSCLESSLTSTHDNGRGIGSTSTLTQLAQVLSSVLDVESGTLVPADLRLLSLRILLNMTNNNKRASNIFAISNLVTSLIIRINRDFKVLEKNQDIATMDELVLSLGAMINLAELSDAARNMTLKDNGTALTQAVEILKNKQHTMSESQNVEESTLNVYFGYLALLLVNLCQTEAVRQQILAQIPLEQLISVTEEFIRIHQETDQKIADSEGVETYSESTNRLITMVNRLKEIKD